MAKNKVSQYDATAANNTDVANINIAEGCSPSNVNNAIRAVMSHLKDFQAGNQTGNALAVAGGGTGAENAADARTNLGLGTLATQASSSVSITGGSITGITDLAVADGGTGASTLDANAVLLGNGTSALQTVAPSTSGNILTSNGTTWTSAAAPSTIASIQAFTSSGTFTVPANVTKIKVTVTAGGGGGASGNGSYAGSGGGAGGTAIEVISGLTPASTITVTVGAGGSIGNAGGTSSFGSYCSANGGAAGVATSNTSEGGLGGTASGGDINITGGDGESITSGPDYAGKAGDGGGSIWGSGGRARDNNDNGTAGAGRAYGAGGGGGSRTGTGAAGAGGIVVVEY